MLAEELFKLHRYQPAAELYEQAIKQNPNDVVYYLRLGAAYFRQGKYSEARDAFGRAAARFPKSLDHLSAGLFRACTGTTTRRRPPSRRSLQSDNADVIANLDHSRGAG